MSLPPEVIARCAATTGTYGGCHGASASGIRVPDGQSTENETASLAELSADMQTVSDRWLAREADQTERRRWDRARKIAAYIAKEGL